MWLHQVRIRYTSVGVLSESVSQSGREEVERMCGAIRRCDGCAAVQLSLHCVPALVLHSRDAATVAAVATATAAVAEAASYTIVAPLLQDAE